MHQAKLAKKQKRYTDAQEFIDQAIVMDPGDLSLYQVRAGIQRVLDFNESQVKHNLADGYLQAGNILKMRKKVPEGKEADQKAKKILAELAKDETNGNARCDSNLATCSITKTVEVSIEPIYSGILAVRDDTGTAKTVEARIDKGSEDGMVVGSQGDVWSQYSKSDDGHEREIARLGGGEVLAVEPHSALIRIQVDEPKDDGLVRKYDMIQLRVRVPVLPGRSSLWSVAKYDVTFLDLDDKIIFDYKTLYSNETADLDSRLFQRMLQDIHRAGGLSRDRLDNQWMLGKPLQKGIFAGQMLSAAMESTTLVELKKFFDAVVKNPGAMVRPTQVSVPGRVPSGPPVVAAPNWQKWHVSDAYAAWVRAGTPSE